MRPEKESEKRSYSSVCSFQTTHLSGFKVKQVGR